MSGMALSTWVTMPTPASKAAATEAQAHHHAALAQGGDHLHAPLQLRRQGHQGDVGGGLPASPAVEATDALLERRRAGGRQVFGGVGAAPFVGQEGPFQVGAEQAAAPGLVTPSGFGQHLQGLAQRLHAAGDQGGTDRLHPVTPEPLQQLPQPRQI
jgi:hypothetical protein